MISININAQYRINRSKYDFRSYSYQPGDPYNPSFAGIASLLIPGLGQMTSGEVGRGFCFLGGCLGCMTVSIAGFATFFYYMDTDEAHDKVVDPGKSLLGLGITAIGLIGAFVVDIGSVVDAVNVAKVNNLAYRDKNKTSGYLNIQPYLNTSIYNTTNKIPVGMTLKITF
jgi:hypothetical protein